MPGEAHVYFTAFLSGREAPVKIVSHTTAEPAYRENVKIKCLIGSFRSGFSHFMYIDSLSFT